jgi:copper transport protein
MFVPGSRVRRLVWGALTAALALLVTPDSAFAHGKLKASSPGAGAHLGIIPRELRLDFTEVPDLTFSRVSLIGPGGAAVALGALSYAQDSHRAVVAAIDVSLAAGTYTVRWQLAGDDGHPVRGDFRFTVAPGAMLDTASSHVMPGTMPMSEPGAGGMVMHHDPASMPEGTGFGAESPVYVILRWLQFIALLLTIGSVAFRQFVLGSMRGGSQSPTRLIHAADLRAARVGLIAIAALFGTLASRLVAQSYAMHGAADLWNVRLSVDMIEKTMWGNGWLVQLVGIVFAGTGFALAYRAGMRRPGPAQKGQTVGSPLSGWSLATFGVVLLALSTALSGHATAVPNWRGVAITADALHVIGASSWLGALTLLLLAGVPALAELDVDARGAAVARLVNAFSRVALVGAGLTVITGVVAAWLHLGRIPALWGTRYGLTLVAKLAVLSVVALVGLYNWRFVQPRLGTDDATARLRRSATVEVGVAVLVLLVTAVLVATPTALDAGM